MKIKTISLRYIAPVNKVEYQEEVSYINSIITDLKQKGEYLPARRYA